MALLIEGYSKGTEETLGPSVELLFLSSQFKQHMTGLLEARERDLDGEPGALVAQPGACTVSDLAAVVGLQPNGMTILTDRLSDRGLVTRKRSRIDRRVVMVSLTSAGREQASELEQKATDQLSQLLAPVSEVERLELISFLFRLASRRA